LALSKSSKKCKSSKNSKVANNSSSYFVADKWIY